MPNSEAAEKILPAGQCKPLLVLSKREPVSCAVGLTSSKDAVILLLKKREPRAMAAELRKKAALAGIKLDAASVRFGRAEVDTDADAGLVRLVVNKEAAAAMRPALLVVLKKAGFQRCELTIEAALDEEAPGADPAAQTEAGASHGAAGAEHDAAGALAAIRTDLAALAAQVGAVPDSGRRAELLALANGANGSLKAGDAAQARLATDALRTALHAAQATGPGVGPAGPGHGTKPGGAPPQNGAQATIGKSRTAWVLTRASVDGELNKLLAAMKHVYAGHSFGKAVEGVFHAKVGPVVAGLDTVLAETLDAAAKEPDPDRRRSLLDQVEDTIQRYERHVSSHPLLAQLDENPFVPLKVGKLLGDAFGTLRTSLGLSQRVAARS